MHASFLQQIREELSPQEAEVLAEAGIVNADDLYALTLAFPSLDEEEGVDISKLSDLGARSASSALLSVGHSIISSGPTQYPLGATEPPGVPTGLGFEVPPGGGVVVPLPSPPSYDYRRNGWTVRHQGQRGTCVAHALAAVREFRCDPLIDLSEQFLFWAAKEHGGDPSKATDGTRLEYASTGLQLKGVCEEHHWPYSGAKGATVTHASATAPSATAVTQAATHACTGKYYSSSKMSGNAALLLAELKANKGPVAVSLPIYAGRNAKDSHNWNTSVAALYGRVLDPVRRTVVVGAHAVCVTGFVPDAAEPLGGYFIFRNSWGTTWGSGAPDPSCHTPEPGYGQISARYVDRHLWEMCSLP